MLASSKNITCQQADFPCHLQALGWREIAFHMEVIFLITEQSSDINRRRHELMTSCIKTQPKCLHGFWIIILSYLNGNAPGLLLPHGLIKIELTEWYATFFRNLFNGAFSYVSHTLTIIHVYTNRDCVCSNFAAATLLLLSLLLVCSLLGRPYSCWDNIKNPS
jgi:hypothetical protein